jgi:hypothetical protein
MIICGIGIPVSFPEKPIPDTEMIGFLLRLLDFYILSFPRGKRKKKGRKRGVIFLFFEIR